ncbi:hypothetical protein [Actinocrispum wychmicini]|uniref:DoxX-like protein n=1 Tax=Actinocrispum wychmicini TaxID=1213861 RepID=A0A4R2J2Q1_9PSEU|nr:hypothetical protein [Actinocrispum wychmicini]TCO52593.1 hypothetical protein EV192_112325 [Actinocrispum wychmicini]
MRAWTRGLVILLAVTQGIIGFWAQFGPTSFFEDGPIPGANSGWVALFPPYNEHLVRDYGGMNLALVVVLVVAAVKLTPLWVRTSMVATLAFAVPHTVFHIIHLEHFSRSAAIGQTTSLVLTVLIPLIVIMMAGQLRRTEVKV